MDEVIAVPIELGSSIELGEPVVLWGASFRDLDGQPEWEVLDNGERFVIANRGEQIVREGEQQQTTLNVIVNWPRMLEE